MGLGRQIKKSTSLRQKINQLYDEVRAKHSTFIYTCILQIMTINARSFYREVMKTQTSKIARLLNRDIDVDEHLLNISSNELTFFEKLVLCRGLKFSLPQVVQPIEVKASFEKLYCKIEPFIADYLKELTAASLKSIALNYIQRQDSRPPKLLKKAIKSLKKRNDIIITKPG